MNQEIIEEEWKKRMIQLEEKNILYKLKRREKNELKALHRKNTEIKKQIKIMEEKKKEEEKKRRKRKRRPII